MRILFITATRLGDAILSTGLLAEIRRHWPDAAITVVCGPVPAPLFAGQPGITDIIPLTKRRRGRHWFDLWRTVATRRWDMVIDLRGSALAWTLWAGRRRVLRGKPGPDTPRVAALAKVMGFDPPPAPHLHIPAAAAAAADRIIAGRPVLALGATANWHAKQWPAERFCALAQILCAQDLPPETAIAVLGAPHERASITPLLTGLPQNRLIDLTVGLDLPVLAALIARAVLFIGNDSGLMHLAAAVGCPTLGLFGPTRAQAYAPWGAGNRAIRTIDSVESLVGVANFNPHTCPNLMTGLSVDAVLTAARAMLAAHPTQLASFSHLRSGG